MERRPIKNRPHAAVTPFLYVWGCFVADSIVRSRADLSVTQAIEKRAHLRKSRSQPHNVNLATSEASTAFNMVTSPATSRMETTKADGNFEGAVPGHFSSACEDRFIGPMVSIWCV